MNDHLALLEMMLAVSPSILSFEKLKARLGWKSKSTVKRAMNRLATIRPKLVEQDLDGHWRLTKKGRADAEKLMNKGAF